MKYTPIDGEIRVRVAMESETDVRLSVRDTGIGISSKYHDAVFERFYRVGDTGEAVPGAGLGLALVKELAESHGGSVELESSPGRGTTISVIFPRHELEPTSKAADTSIVETVNVPLEIAAATTHDGSVVTQGNGQGVGQGNGLGNGQKTLLIVEDNMHMQEYLVSLLADNYHCQIASDGEEGLRSALEEVPDLVLCDVMMPKMDGFLLSRSLRENEHTSHIPIVLLTGRGDHDSRLQGLREHVDDYLTKPFNDEELLLRIENLFSARDAMQRKYSRQLYDGSEVNADIDSKELKFLHKLQTVLEQNYTDPEFRVERLSSEMAMSDRQLQRKLKALIDHSPAEFLRNFRLKIAAKQLETGTQVGLVSEAVGFSSQAYFASCFKAEFGTTPSEFQQRFS
jgi:DNA-binding response OmpR family regulator